MIDEDIYIETKRLYLRPVQISDAEAIHEAKKESWDALAQWMVWTQKPLHKLSLEDDREQCQDRVDRFKRGETITLCGFKEGTEKFVGACGLHKCDWENKIAYLGFWVRSNETRQGYAFEMGKALADYAFKTLKFKELKSFHAAGNNGSSAALKKLGFKQTEVKHQAHNLLDINVDEIHYTLTPSRKKGS